MMTLFGETSFVFSELIRTAFIPSEGCRFVVSDFSAIEARVISGSVAKSGGWRPSGPVRIFTARPLLRCTMCRL